MNERNNPCESLTPGFYIEFLTIVDSNDPDKQKRREDMTKNLTPDEIECLKRIMDSFGKGMEGVQNKDLE